MRGGVVWLCVVATWVLAVAGGGSESPIPPPSLSCGLHGMNCGCPVVSSLLQAVGFSQTCVASSLAMCSHLQGETQFGDVMEELRVTMQEVRGAIEELKMWQARPRNCKDLLAAGDSGRGVRQVYPYPGRPQDTATVVCDHTVDGGGWTVFQFRTNATTREDFVRTWVEYQLGFGNIDGEFWLGLDLLHILTSSSLQELRIDLVDYEGEKRWAKYGFFSLGPSQDNYRLSVGRYSGNAGDGLSKGGHNGKQFSTPEADHDSHSINCAASYRGGWWYAGCHLSNLNGYQHEGHHETYAEGINWQPWKGYHYSLMNTSLMIRPSF